MKAIMLSVKPEYVEKILNNTKTIEIRKSKPSCELPCKVYIYCTKGKYNFFGVTRKVEELPYSDGIKMWGDLGKVVAEFTLNKIDKIEICDPYVFRNGEQEDWWYFNLNACLGCEQMMDYIGYGNDNDGYTPEYAVGYAWHIDDLKIYDKPKELSEFRKDIDCDDYPCNKGKFCEYDYYDITEGCSACGIDFDGEHCIYKTIKRPPQSWCYVEEMIDNDRFFATEEEAEAKLEELKGENK